LSSGPLVIWLLIQTGIVGIWRSAIRTVVSRIDTAANDLALLSGLLERIEREPFTSPKLATLAQKLATDGLPPSRRIAQFERLVSVLDQSTRNQFFAPIAALLVLRSQVAVAIDRWHATYGQAVATWLETVGELEALSAL